MHIIPRLKQGEYEHKNWTAGFGWAEVFDLFYLANNDDFNAITEKELEQELRKLKL